MDYQEQDYTKSFDLGLWQRVLKLTVPYRRWLAIICFCMVATALIDVGYSHIRRFIIDIVIVQGDMGMLPVFLGVWVIGSLVQTLLVRAFITVAGKVEANITHDIRQMGFKRLQELSFSFFDQTPVGFIMARMSSDAQRMGDTIGWVLVELLWGSSYILFTLITMFFLSPSLALIIVAVLPILAVFSVFFQKIILTSYRIARKTNSRITSSFNEGIMGARTTKTLLREERNLEEFKELTGEMHHYSTRAANFSSLFYPVVNTLGAVGAALVLTRGGDMVALEGLSLGTLIVMVQYAVSFFDPIRDIARIFADLQSSQAAAERVMTLLETEPDIVDSPQVEENYGDNFTPKRENWEEMRGDVAFENVSFQYKAGETVLQDFNLDLKAGQTIALVGETGSGKSTIVNLVCRFYEPTAGRILIDGRDIRERSQLWLQSNLGYVLQQPHLFSGTIRENIRYGRMEATDDEVEEAARLVNAEQFILRLEKGYDTEVEEGGGRLSTGEKQLISFARAMIANPRLFVLDEATSSVDTETEQIIQTAIQKVLDGRTSFIIAHRLSTVRSADRILVIDKGRIIEDGSHRELLRRKGHYYTLYTNQFKEERQAELLKASGSDSETS